MRKKGFTLVELLVVIAIIALLMGILMPALARVRMIAYRMICGTNLSGLGKAILLYAGDSKEEFPMPGCSKLVKLQPSGTLNNWDLSGGGNGPPAAFNCDTTGTATTPPRAGGVGTIGSVWYLLIRYEDVSVKQFNCKGDVGVKTFKLTDYPTTPQTDLTKVYDFGLHPGLYNSYSYQNPFNTGGLTVSGSNYGPNANSPPSMPMAADRNPTLDGNVNYLASANTPGGQVQPPGATETSPYQEWLNNNNEYKDKDLVYNSFAHQREGQNVLFADGHVSFSKTANVGIDNDNIWQKCPNPLGTGAQAKKDREVGGYFPQKNTTGGYQTNTIQGGPGYDPATITDSLLISEPLYQ
jgi:prepilin-type N-terminal cleavage/methylation domain-containing protein/prepilin-type processing-associated H-X9-DG protein